MCYFVEIMNKIVKDSRTIVLQIYLHPVILLIGGFIKI